MSQMKLISCVDAERSFSDGGMEFESVKLTFCEKLLPRSLRSWLLESIERANRLPCGLAENFPLVVFLQIPTCASPFLFELLEHVLDGGVVVWKGFKGFLWHGLSNLVKLVCPFLNGLHDDHLCGVKSKEEHACSADLQLEVAAVEDKDNDQELLGCKRPFPPKAPFPKFPCSKKKSVFAKCSV